MEEVIKIIGVGLISLIISIILKQYKSEYVIYVSLIAGAIIIYFVVDKFSNIINMIESIANNASINSSSISILLKITGIAILTEYAVSICKDSGESAIGNKIELGSKVVIISMSIPIISSLLEVIMKILPS